MVILTFMALVASGIIVYRVIALSSDFVSRQCWSGPRWRYYAMTVSVALTGGGALAMLIGWWPAPYLLLFGTAGSMLFDRRHCESRTVIVKQTVGDRAILREGVRRALVRTDKR